GGVMLRATIGFLIALLIAPAVSGQVTTPPAGAAPPASAERVFVNTYCFGCHNAQRRTAGLDLDAANVDRVGASAPTWEKVVRYLRSGLHPPQGATPRPDKGSIS